MRNNALGVSQVQYPNPVTDISGSFPFQSLLLKLQFYDPGIANATMLLPEGASFLPPPQTITIYSRPFNS